MTAADLLLGVLWASLTIYVVFAGADFGGGVWDMLASGPGAREQRSAIARAMGPVWEANHVWLIFMITGLFTGFPSVFAVLSVALYLPLTIGLIGVVLRGAAFAFRAHGREAVGPLTGWGAVFGASSVVAPLFFGMAAAANAAGGIPGSGGGLGNLDRASWLTPLTVCVGLLAVAFCAYLAGTFLMVETAGHPDLKASFRRRATGAGLAAGAFGLLGLALARQGAPVLWAGLSGRALPLVVLALLNGPLALWAVWSDRPRLARVLVAGQVTLVLWAWGVAQYPYLVVASLTVAGSAAPAATLVGLLAIVLAGMILTAPSLLLLFRIFKGSNPAAA